MKITQALCYHENLNTQAVSFHTDLNARAFPSVILKSSKFLSACRFKCPGPLFPNRCVLLVHSESEPSRERRARSGSNRMNATATRNHRVPQGITCRTKLYPRYRVEQNIEPNTRTRKREQDQVRTKQANRVRSEQNPVLCRMPNMFGRAAEQTAGTKPNSVRSGPCPKPSGAYGHSATPVPRQTTNHFSHFDAPVSIEQGTKSAETPWSRSLLRFLIRTASSAILER